MIIFMQTLSEAIMDSPDQNPHTSLRDSNGFELKIKLSEATILKIMPWILAVICGTGVCLTERIPTFEIDPNFHVEETQVLRE